MFDLRKMHLFIQIYCAKGVFHLVQCIVMILNVILQSVNRKQGIFIHKVLHYFLASLPMSSVTVEKGKEKFSFAAMRTNLFFTYRL